MKKEYMKYKWYFDNSVLLNKYVSLTNEKMTIPTRHLVSDRVLGLQVNAIEVSFSKKRCRLGSMVGLLPRLFKNQVFSLSTTQTCMNMYVYTSTYTLTH